MITRATRNDTKIVAELAFQMWDSSSVEELQREFAEEMAAGSAVFFLAWRDGEPIGFAKCGLRHDYVEGTESSPVGYLEGVFVVENARRQGVARRLVEVCEQYAKELGCEEFASDCELDNEASLHFHLKMGFAEANRIICFSKKL